MSPAMQDTQVLRISSDPMYLLLREGKIQEFNQKKSSGGAAVLAGCDFRNVDLRGMDATGLDFSHSYFRQADLRGVDFSKSCLEGASLNGAKVSGAYFPPELSAEEIALSIEHGTRMRYSAPQK